MRLFLNVDLLYVTVYSLFTFYVIIFSTLFRGECFNIQNTPLVTVLLGRLHPLLALKPNLPLFKTTNVHTANG